MSYGGLRGAVAFALVLVVNEEVCPRIKLKPRQIEIDEMADEDHKVGQWETEGDVIRTILSLGTDFGARNPLRRVLRFAYVYKLAQRLDWGGDQKTNSVIIDIRLDLIYIIRISLIIASNRTRTSMLQVVPQKRMFVTTTIAVIYFTVFCQGMTIGPLVRLLNVPIKETVSSIAPAQLSDRCWG